VKQEDQENLEKRVLLDLLVLEENQVFLELQVYQDFQGSEVCRDYQGCQDSRVNLDHWDLWDPKEIKDSKVIPEVKGHLDNKEDQARLVDLEDLVLKEKWDPLVFLDQLVGMDYSAVQVCQALLGQLVSLAKMATKEKSVPLVKRVLRETKDQWALLDQ